MASTVRRALSTAAARVADAPRARITSQADHHDQRERPTRRRGRLASRCTPPARPFPRERQDTRGCPGPIRGKTLVRRSWPSSKPVEQGFDVGQPGLVFVGDDLGDRVKECKGVDMAGGDGQRGRRHARECGIEPPRIAGPAAQPGVEQRRIERFDGVDHDRFVVPRQGRPGVVDRGKVTLEHGHDPGIARLARPRRRRQQPLEVPGVDEQPGQGPLGQLTLDRFEPGQLAQAGIDLRAGLCPVLCRPAPEPCGR